MSGPAAALPDMDAVKSGIDDTSLINGDVVFVLDLNKYVLVIQDRPIQGMFTTINDFEADAATYSFERMTPGMLSTAGSYDETALYTPECGAGPINPAKTLSGGNNATSPYQVLSHGTDSGSEIPIDSDDLIAAATVS